MKPVHALAFLAAALLAGAAHAVDVYKWTDSKGVVHYGDRPASGAASSMLQVPGSTMSDEEEEEAQQRLDQAREKLLEPTYDQDAWRYRSQGSRRVAQPASGCADSWKRYDAAQACFAAHRAAGGKGANAVAQAYCPQVTQPSCAR